MPPDTVPAPSVANKGGAPGGFPRGRLPTRWTPGSPARVAPHPYVSSGRRWGRPAPCPPWGGHLREVLADRLLAGASPDRGSPEEIVIKSLKAAMGPSGR